MSSRVASFFQGAHDLVINDLTIAQMIDSSQLGTILLHRLKPKVHLDTVLYHLKQKSTPGATLDSSSRKYPPRCHPDTRKSLRGRLVKWITVPDRQWKMVWVSGLAGVGKSAIAQTIAEDMERLGRIVAVFFFSRPNHLNDPDCVVPTLAYQLATRHPHYKHIITQRIADDPMILEKNIRFQFKALITEPFQQLMTQHPSTVRQPILIILDGLDECNSKEAQCEFVELANAQARLAGFPLLWMVCSRPEWHLKNVFSNADFHVTCGREEVSIDDDEAQEDVSRLLRSGFQSIRTKYSDRVSNDWPEDADVRCITAAASGHLGFVSFILRFIGDVEYSAPSSQLKACIRFLGGSGTARALNPLHALDLLYRRILSDIHPDVLATTMNLLGMLILFPRVGLTARNQANFFGLAEDDFYQALRQLHSVLYVPLSSDAHTVSLRIYHASFSDFLKDPRRSREFVLNAGAIQYDVAVRSLGWQDTFTRSHSTLPTESLLDPTHFLYTEFQQLSGFILCRIEKVRSWHWPKYPPRLDGMHVAMYLMQTSQT